VLVEPIVSTSAAPVPADGESFCLRDWRGSGPADLHVHYADDEAWYVREGTLQFRFGERTLDASAGTTVFVPAGVPHTFTASEDARYLLILTPRLRELIAELQTTRDPTRQAEIYRRHRSELLSS
jgi:mannose-6-phosphate isomerase-like protein (cupin superfamily)